MSDGQVKVRAISVELVGGPFCGASVWWPVEERALTLIFCGNGYRYELDWKTAVYKA